MEAGRYQILDVVGSGGMATVWRARDTRLGRVVAIKRPNPAAPATVDLARFAREARAAARIAHRHVVAVYDAGVDDEGPYLVMELVDGPQLAEATIPVEGVAEVGAQIASALAALHAAGVVHGDVKPGNILLAADGAKLTDFGIARTVDDTMTLSLPGVVLATPAYAAPETLAHGEHSPAADVYSLAAVLYELLTGSRWRPEPGTTQPMPPHEWAQALAPALAADPSERPTAATFAATLAALHTDQPDAAPTTPLHLQQSPDIAPTTRAAGTPERTGRLAVAVFAAVVAAVIALVLAAASLGGGDGTGTVGQPSSVPTSPAPEPTAAPTTVEPAVTEPPLTSPPTTPPTSAPPVTAPPATRTASDVAAELVALIAAVPSNELKPNDARDLVERVEDVVRVAADEPDAAAGALRDAAEQAAKDLDDTARADAERLLTELAAFLGIDPSTVSDRFD